MSRYVSFPEARGTFLDPGLNRLDHDWTLTNPQAGVKDIVLAVNYRPEVMVSVLKKTEEEYGIKIHFSVETEPLGTGALSSFVASCRIGSCRRLTSF